MNILFSVSNFFPHGFGGGQVYVHRLAREFERRGHRVHVVTSAAWENGNTGHYALKRYRYDGLPVTAIEVNPESMSEGDRYSELGPILLEGLHSVQKEIQPDLVHINGLKAAAATVSNRLNIPNIVTAHHAGICCPAGDLINADGDICGQAMDPGICVSCCSLKRSPRWYTGGLLGKLPRSIYQPVGRRLAGFHRLPYVARALRYPWLIEESIRGKAAIKKEAGFVIAPSVFMQKLLMRNGYASDRLRVLPHGISPVEKSLPVEGKAVRLGYLGRVNPPKGLHVLIKALEHLPPGECELHVYGAPQYPWEEEYLKGCLNNYRGKSKILMHGAARQQELPKVFASFDILAVPSLVPESFGLAVAEAFSAGRPVIVSSAGALPEQVRNGIDGFVVARGDSIALGKVIQELMNDPHRIEELRRSIRQPKTIGEYADEMEAIYSSTIDGDSAKKRTGGAHA